MYKFLKLNFNEYESEFRRRQEIEPIFKILIVLSDRSLECSWNESPLIRILTKPMKL